MRAIALLCLCLLAGATFAHPGASIHVAADGRVFFVDTGGGVFVVQRDGKLVKLPGPAFHWFALDEASRLAKTRWPAIPGAEITAVGTRPTIVLSSDFPDAVGSDGALYYPQPVGDTQWTMVRVAPDGARSIAARWPARKRSDGELQYVNGLAATREGLYFSHDRSLHRIDARGKVATVADNLSVPNCTRIPGVEAQVGPYLRGLDVAPNGTVFVAATGCGAVLMVTPQGRASVVLRTQAPWSPTAVAVANGEVFVLEYLHTASDDRTSGYRACARSTAKGRSRPSCAARVDAPQRCAGAAAVAILRRAPAATGWGPRATRHIRGPAWPISSGAS